MEKWAPARIRALRRQFGERQSDFARRFRLSTETVKAWEQGKSSPPGGPATVLLDQLEAQVAALAEK